MMLRLARAMVSASALLAATVARADDELDRIPAASNTQAAAEGNANNVFYLQDDLIANARRNVLVVPFPPPPAPSWEERLFADARQQWSLVGDLNLVYSGRLNLRAEDGLAFPGHENIRHDFREGYLAWTADTETFVDLGRINLKSGVALGFNPTDFFRTRAVVEPLSADPSILRDDRLGTFMLYGQHLWNGGALTLAVAPKLRNETPIYQNDKLPSFDPMFDRTNAATRILARANFSLFEDFNPEVLVYSEDGRWRLGTNLTRGFGQSVVAYLEWSGGDRGSLSDEALRYGRATGTLPAAAPAPIPVDSKRAFQNDVALGLSYTTETKITFNLEYHFHEAGFSGSDWRHWFAAGALHSAPLDAELWYIRGYAADQQEPVARHEAFLRADWQDAFVRDLELTAFLNADLRDGSGFAQATADYYVSREWTVGALASTAFGGRRSDYGSLPGSATFLLRVSRYF